MELLPAEIKKFGDYQINWPRFVETLRPGRWCVENRSMAGDAPKDFIRIKEFVRGHSNSKRRRWPAYIAKVGSKRYPVESITEHLFTRIGQSFALNIASSKLMIVAGQVRFLSRYFLQPDKESLVHGLEIFRRYLDDEEIIREIAEERREREFYTFQTVAAAVREIYPMQEFAIMRGVVEMLAFDAVAGNNDRHPLNWGVIAPLAKSGWVRFAPVFDTARGMFWNLDDSQLGKFVTQDDSIGSYVAKSRPQIAWDGEHGIDHFRLIRLIATEFPEYRASLRQFCRDQALASCHRIIEEEFAHLMSDVRRTAIRRCLKRRFELYCAAVV